tara:strand:- start:408 stop:1463 length:1056 start_codon:yes stop_codon:yes gene_type:complete
MYAEPARPSMSGKKHVIVLDIDDQYEKDGDKHILGGAERFNIKLNEPLQTKNCELYLDNVITYNCNITNDNDNCAFLLELDGINVNTTVASNSSNIESAGRPSSTHGNDMISNKIIIPNENDSVGNYYTGIIHKSKKLNYLADINKPLTHLSGKITNLNGDPIFHGQQKGNNFTYSFSNIKWNSNGSTTPFSGSTTNASFNYVMNGSISHLYKNTEFMLWSARGTDVHKISCVLLNDTPINAKTIMFSTNAHHDDVVIPNFKNASAVNMLFATRHIKADDFGTPDINTHGGIPSEPPGSLGYTKVLVSNIDMNLNIEDKAISGETAHGYPELYYESGRFTAEFTLIEKNNN